MSETQILCRLGSQIELLNYECINQVKIMDNKILWEVKQLLYTSTEVLHYYIGELPENG